MSIHGHITDKEAALVEQLLIPSASNFMHQGYSVKVEPVVDFSSVVVWWYYFRDKDDKLIGHGKGLPTEDFLDVVVKAQAAVDHYIVYRNPDGQTIYPQGGDT